MNKSGARYIFSGVIKNGARHLISMNKKAIKGDRILFPGEEGKGDRHFFTNAKTSQSPFYSKASQAPFFEEK